MFVGDCCDAVDLRLDDVVPYILANDIVAASQMPSTLPIAGVV